MRSLLCVLCVVLTLVAGGLLCSDANAQCGTGAASGCGVPGQQSVSGVNQQLAGQLLSQARVGGASSASLGQVACNTASSLPRVALAPSGAASASAVAGGGFAAPAPASVAQSNSVGSAAASAVAPQVFIPQTVFVPQFVPATGGAVAASASASAAGAAVAGCNAGGCNSRGLLARIFRPNVQVTKVTAITRTVTR